MTPTIAKAIYVLLAVGWYVIRFPYARRAGRTPVKSSRRGPREIALLVISLAGMGVLPFVYVATGFPKAADYAFQPVLAWLGLGAAIASLAMFIATHRALGRFWSVSLDVREGHKLATEGVYRHVRHPMYVAFWLWAVAQALLLPNWVAGMAGLVGFGTLYFLRVAREEQMMMDAFGEDYRAYMTRTKRLIPGIY